MCVDQLFRGGRGEWTKTHPLALHQQSFSATTSLIRNTFTLLIHYGVICSFHSFPQQQCHRPQLPLVQPLQFCAPHLPVPTNPSQILHVTNRCTTSSPAPLSHTSHHFTSLILQQPSWASPQSEQHPYNFLTLHRLYILLHPTPSLASLLFQNREKVGRLPVQVFSWNVNLRASYIF